MVSTDDFLSAAAYRRTIYNLKDTAVPDERVQDILEQVLSFAPSSYNTQTTRITLITGERHKQFWDVVIAAVSPRLKAGEEVFKQMSRKLAGHKNAHGSVLFWESSAVTEKAAREHASAANLFPMYGEHSSGRLRFWSGPPSSWKGWVRTFSMLVLSQTWKLLSKHFVTYRLITS